MDAPIYGWLEDSSAVIAQLANAKYGLAAFEDEAPQGFDVNSSTYLIYFVVGGVPDNIMDAPPPGDAVRYQFDIFGPNRVAVRNVYRAVRDALEPNGHIVAFIANGRDETTKRWRRSFDMNFREPRS